MLLASVELSSTVEDVTSMPLVGVLNGSLVERGDSVLSWLLKLEVSKALVENPDSLGVEDVSSLLLVPEMLAEVSVALSKLVDWDPVKDEEASGSLVEVSTGLWDPVDVPAEVSELSKEVDSPLVAVILPDSVDNVLLSGGALVGSVETNDVPVLGSVLSASLDDKEVEKPVGSLCDEDCASVDNGVSVEATLLVLTSVEEGPGVGPDGDVTSVEMLP